MDDALKARLIGASILVVLAVVLLPELLSGPKAPAGGVAGGKGTRTYTIDLGGAVDAARAPRPDVQPTPAATTPALPTVEPMATVAASDDTSEPETVPTDEVTVEKAPEPTPAVPAKAPVSAPAQVAASAASAPAAAATKPTASPEPAPKPNAASGKYSVQVGAFGSPDGARKLVADLKGAGFSAYIVPPAAGKKLHRVRVGPVADRAAADQLASRLKARGLPTAVTADG